MITYPSHPPGNLTGDLSGVGEKFRLSWTDFKEEVLPELTSADLIIYVDIDDGQQTSFMTDIERLLRDVEKSPATLGSLLVSRRKQAVRLCRPITPSSRTHHPFLQESKLSAFIKEMTRLHAIVGMQYMPFSCFIHVSALFTSRRGALR